MYSYVTRMYSYVTCMYSYVTHMYSCGVLVTISILLICTRMLLICTCILLICTCMYTCGVLVMIQGNFPKSADFTASCKIYTVFHASSCFKSSIMQRSLPSIMSSRINGF